MRTLSSGIAMLLMVAASGLGCGGDGSPAGPVGVLTTLDVTPPTASLFTVAPGNAVTLLVVAKDQDGNTMAGTPTFSSGDDGIASVSGAGTVTAVAPGTAQVTASLTLGSVTKTGTTSVTVQVAPASGDVVAPGFVFSPQTVEVQAGGTVTWTFENVGHTVTFNTGGAPADVPELFNGSASRTFPTNGSFNYHCTIHPVMTGTVHVH